jgi:amino acid transporter
MPVVLLCMASVVDRPSTSIATLLLHAPFTPAALATVAAMLTSFCYAEYAAEVSVAGGPFNWVSEAVSEPA